MADQNTRFMLPGRGVRGQFVQLSASWQTVHGKADYPAAIATLLGEALAATAALSGLIKFDGAIVFQLQSEGALRLLVAQITHQGGLRGLARYETDMEANLRFEKLVGDQARLVMTIDGEDRERYQGIVAAEQAGIAATVEAYFAQSEQLLTRIWLAADQHHASALLLQQLPDAGALRENDWTHVTTLADTLRDEELLTLSAKDILHRLFHEEDVQLFPPQPLRFACSCSQEKVTAAIRGLGEADAQDLVEEKGEIRADCEFCGEAYRFDAVDVAAIFQQLAASGSSARH